MNKWSIIHDYRRAVMAGKAERLRHDCGNLFVVKIGKDDDPVLHCFVCPATVTPGLDMLEQLQREAEQ